VDRSAEDEGCAGGVTDGGSDDGFNVAPGAVGGRGIRRCFGIDTGWTLYEGMDCADYLLKGGLTGCGVCWVCWYTKRGRPKQVGSRSGCTVRQGRKQQVRLDHSFLELIAWIASFEGLKKKMIVVFLRLSGVVLPHSIRSKPHCSSPTRSSQNPPQAIAFL